MDAMTLPDPNLTVIPALPEASWLQMPREPMLWYLRFAKYFLPLGPSRTIVRAFMLFTAAENPNARILKVRVGNFASTNWQEKSKAWQWHSRAEAFDRNNLLEYSTLIDTARNKLMHSLGVAVDALVGALDNPRLAVSAAKEILDRGGLPGTTNIGIGPASRFNADELSKAQAEIEDWEHAQHN